MIIYSSIIFICLFTPNECEWNFIDFELFDLVEDVNESFYVVLDVDRDASNKDIKKSFRQLSRKFHPDKNPDPDAEKKFRQLAAVHEVLLNEEKRQKYDKILDEGLPNWRQPVYYFRRMRKLSLTEILFSLGIIFTLGQYGVAWASYYEKKFYMPQRGKYKHIEILKPSFINLWPYQLWVFIWTAIYNIPYIVECLKFNIAKFIEKLKTSENSELYMHKEKRTKSKKNIVIPQISDDLENTEIAEVIEIDGEKHQFRPQDMTGRFWEDEDMAELSKLMRRFPGGYKGRWEVIAHQMNRSVYEVTKMARKIKENDYKAKQTIQTEECQEVPELCKELGKQAENLIMDNWTQQQQTDLENALVKFPKGTMERWDRIAEMVQGKNKEECLKRFKYLAHLIKVKKKQENSELK